MLIPHPVRPLLGLILILVLASPTLAEDAPDKKAEPAKPQVLAGRVDARRVDGVDAPQTRYVIAVGKAKFILRTKDGSEAPLKKLAGKYIEITRPAASPPRAWISPVTLDSTMTVGLQKARTITGIVRVQAAGTRSERFALEADGTMWAIAASDARRFKKLADTPVEVKTMIATSGASHALVGIKRVAAIKQKPHKGFASAGAALEASWSGVFTATRVPPGVPGASTGDFDGFFYADKKLKAVKGRLFGTYDIVGIEVDKFSRKKRTTAFQLVYTYGKGNFRARMTGTFSEDWKHLEGEWSGEFIGGGTFKLTAKREK